jgi:hypothetical protein
MLDLLIFFGLIGLIVWYVVQANRGPTPPPQQDWRRPPQQDLRPPPPRQQATVRNTARSQTHHAAPGNAHEEGDLLAITIGNIKRSFFKRSLGGAILINTSTHNALAIEFDGPAPRGDGIEVEFVQSPNVKRAEIFLRGETYDMVRLPPSTFEALRTVLVQNSRSKNMTDVGSGCLIYNGILP